MWRTSSPGTYSRCCTNSTEKPRYGLLWSPTRKPSTMGRAFSPRASARASPAGAREMVIASRRRIPGDGVEDAPRHVLRGDAFTLGGEIRNEPMPQNGHGDGGDVLGGDVAAALQQGVRLGGQDQVQAGPRPRAPGEPFVD